MEKETIYNRKLISAEVERFKGYGYKESERLVQVLGIYLAKELAWSPIDILYACQIALNDADYSDISDKVGELVKLVEIDGEINNDA